jgi:histidine triad (HIT) family protein
MPQNCLFCSMGSGEVLVQKLYDQADVFAIRDIHPRAPVHALVIPRRHIPMVSDLTSEDGDLLAAVYAAANEVARELGIADSGYRCTFNVGADAGQTIYHLHLHLLGGRQLGAEG